MSVTMRIEAGSDQQEAGERRHEVRERIRVGCGSKLQLRTAPANICHPVIPLVFWR